MKKICFTLAEVLITLGIVGVVSALSLPTLIKNINHIVKSNQIKIFERKLHIAMDQMQASGALLGNYESTYKFVQALSKEIKILNICDGDHLADCWGYNQIITRNSKPPYQISNAKNAKQAFDKMLDDGTDFDSSVGVIFGNGMSMILSYDKKCKWFDPDSRYPDGATSSCIVGIYDLNGARLPNKFGDDVIAFNAARFGGSCTIEIDDICFTSRPFKPTPLTHDECIALKDKLGITYCMDHDSDYWGGAVKACGHVSRMPNSSNYRKLGPDMYNSNGCDANSYAAKEFNLTPNFYMWGNEEHRSPEIERYVFASNAAFNKDRYIEWQNFSWYRAQSTPYGICVDNQ